MCCVSSELFDYVHGWNRCASPRVFIQKAMVIGLSQEHIHWPPSSKLTYLSYLHLRRGNGCPQVPSGLVMTITCCSHRSEILSQLLYQTVGCTPMVWDCLKLLICNKYDKRVVGVWDKGLALPRFYAHIHLFSVDPESYHWARILLRAQSWSSTSFCRLSWLLLDTTREALTLECW